MEVYTSFAQVYDALMDDIPYDAWCEYVNVLLKEYQIEDGAPILELGCGTGNITRRLAGQGYRMIGLDLSEEMLSIAKEKQIKIYDTSGAELDFSSQSVNDIDHILYIRQDMKEFTLGECVSVIISLCDSMNYMLDDQELLAVLKRVKEHLAPGGIFIFDMKTPYFYQEICGNNVFAEDREDVSYIWDNCFDEERRINEYALTLFVPFKEGSSNLWQKFTEFHYQRAYEIFEVKRIIKESGLTLHACYEAFTHKKPGKKTERVYYIVGS